MSSGFVIQITNLFFVQLSKCLAKNFAPGNRSDNICSKWAMPIWSKQALAATRAFSTGVLQKLRRILRRHSRRDRMLKICHRHIFLTHRLEKWAKEPAGTEVPAPPCALHVVPDRRLLPHVYIRFPFSYRYRIVSASAPLPLMPTPNNASVSIVAMVSGSGAGRKSIRHTQRNQIFPANAR